MSFVPSTGDPSESVNSRGFLRMIHNDGHTTGWSGSLATGSASTSLLERVTADDPEAWQRLVALYGPTVFHWSRQAGLQPADAADVVQEVFASVSHHIGQFRRGRNSGTFRGWLWTITRNKIRDYYRGIEGQAQAAGGTAAQQRLAELPDPPAETSSATGKLPAEPTPESRALESIRAEFEYRTWEAFRRTAVDKASTAVVAAELNMTAQAVCQARYRIMRRLRDELGGLIDG